MGQQTPRGKLSNYAGSARFVAIGRPHGNATFSKSVYTQVNMHAYSGTSMRVRCRERPAWIVRITKYVINKRKYRAFFTYHHFIVELPRRGYVFHSHGHVSGVIACGACLKRYRAVGPITTKSVSLFSYSYLYVVADFWSGVAKRAASLAFSYLSTLVDVEPTQHGHERICTPIGR